VSVDTSNRLSDRLAIQQLNDDFCHELDRGDADGFVALFTPEALYTNGPRILRGTDQIREFYVSRTRDGPRTSRHFTTGLRIVFQDEKSARGLSACLTFAAPGVPPIESTVPAIVADFDDLYVLRDGKWQFAERHIRPMFKAALPK
jgi:uncharacterized protein (TIGR02246 family)